VANLKPRIQQRPFQHVYENTLVRGESTHYTYRTWEAMFTRCYDPTNCAYAAYGAIGITVCDRWRYGEYGKAGFDCFVEDMGLRPKGTSIDRLDGRKGYFKENCRWATTQEQNVNQCTTVWTKINNEDVYLAEISRRFGIPTATLSQRWAKGWRGDKLISDPIRHSIKTLVIDGEEKTVSEWAKIKGIKRDALIYRIKAGWPESKLFIQSERDPERKRVKAMRRKVNGKVIVVAPPGATPACRIPDNFND
jgi:hypothetical protein